MTTKCPTKRRSFKVMGLHLAGFFFSFDGFGVPFHI